MPTDKDNLITRPMLKQDEQNRWIIPFENNDMELFKCITWHVVQDPIFVGRGGVMNQGEAAEYIGYSPSNFHLKKKQWAQEGISQQATQIITQEKQTWMQQAIQRIMSQMPSMIEAQIKIALGDDAKPAESTAAFKVLLALTEEWIQKNPYAGMNEKRYLDTQVRSNKEFNPHDV